MSLAQLIRRRVNLKKPLELFSQDFVSQQGDNRLAVAQELSRLHATGQLSRAKQGIYFRPKQSRFGDLYPSEADVIKFLLYKGNKRTGYLTGGRLYNRLGLTTQVSGVIEVASREHRRSGAFLGFRVRYVKAYAEVREKDVPLLELLDAIKDLNQIPETPRPALHHLLSNMVQKLPKQDQNRLAQLALGYPPRVCAVLNTIQPNGQALDELA
jgi:hypothetical protein